MGSRYLLIWAIQGVIALCQGRILYLYSFTGSQQDIRKTILILALLYASEAFSMTILLLVYHGKRDIRITQHAFWTTVIFPVIATVTADILYIKVSGRFFLGLFFLLFAAVIYVVAGLGLPMLCSRIFGHSAFRPFTYGRRIPARNGAARHGSIRGNYTGSRAYGDKAYDDRNNRNREYRDREYQDRTGRDRIFNDRENKDSEYKANYNRNGHNQNQEFRGWGFETRDHIDRDDRNSGRKESTSAAADNRPEGEGKEGSGQPEQFHKSRVIIPDYTQEYIDKIDQDYVDRLDQHEEDGLSLVHPKDRPVYYGGSKSRAMVAYINRDNQLISCDERRTGYGRLGRIASSGEVYEYNGGTEAYAGIVTAAGYIRNAFGLDIGCVDEDGNVFRYEGEGALDMTHAKTLVGKVNPGDYSSGAAFLLLLRKEG